MAQSQELKQSLRERREKENRGLITGTIYRFPVYFLKISSLLNCKGGHSWCIILETGNSFIRFTIIRLSVDLLESENVCCGRLIGNLQAAASQRLGCRPPKRNPFLPVQATANLRGCSWAPSGTPQLLGLGANQDAGPRSRRRL